MPAFLLILIVLVIINLALIAWSVNDLFKRKSVKLLPKTGWVIFMALVFFGSVIYILAGRGED